MKKSRVIKVVILVAILISVLFFYTKKSSKKNRDGYWDFDIGECHIPISKQLVIKNKCKLIHLKEF